MIDSLLELDNFCRDLCKQYGPEKMLKCGPGSIAKAYYLGIELEYGVDISEVAGCLEMPIYEVDYLEGLCYKSTSWLRKEAELSRRGLADVAVGGEA